jgi:hypothetical protein
MRTLILLIIILQIFLYSQTDIKLKKVYIEKNNHGGYSVFNLSGEFVCEYTRLNTDSSTLETLADLYLKITSERNSSGVTLIELSDKGFNWSIIIVAFLGLVGTLSAVYFTNRWHSKSQEKRIKTNLFIEDKKLKLQNLRNLISEFIGEAVEANNLAKNMIDPSGYPESEIKELKKYIFKKQAQFGISQTKLFVLIAEDDKKLNLLYNFVNIVADEVSNNIKYREQNNKSSEELETKLKNSINDLRISLRDYIQEEMRKLVQ